MKHAVRLIGGRADGRVVELEPFVRTHAAIVSETPKFYAAGTFAGPASAERWTTVVEFETYRRVDDETFELVEFADECGCEARPCFLCACEGDR